MKKTVTLAASFVLSGLLAAAVHAGPNEGSVAPQTGSVWSAQSGTSNQTAPQKGLSKRNKAVINQEEAAKKRRELIQSGSTSTKPK